MSANKALIVLACLWAVPVCAQPADPVIAQAEAAAQPGQPDPAPALGALFDALRASHDPLRQIALIDAVGRLGTPGGSATPAARAAVQSAGPPLLVALIRDTGNDWSVRGEAMDALRSLGAPDAAVAQAIDAARADIGEHAGYLHARAQALQTWRDSRDTSNGVPAATPEDAARRARLMLQQHDIRVDRDALITAIGQGQAAIVAALLTAGYKVDGPAAPGTMVDILNGMTTACGRDDVPADGVAQSLSLIAGHGYPVNQADEYGNTLLLSAAQYCPPPIAARLLALGAAVDPVNKQHVTPLMMALIGGKWDVAAVLVDHGARISREQADQIFFAPPQEQSQRDLLNRAIR